MKEHRPRPRKLLAVLATLLAVSLPCCWVVGFWTAEDESTPSYDQLNANVLAQLPPPPPARLIKQYSYGNQLTGSYGRVHGRTLEAEYELVEAYDVRAYFRRLFELNGWTKARGAESEYFLRYYRGTGCVTVAGGRIEYLLSIRHDYANQSFSPAPPPYWLLNIAELNGTNFLECPSSWASEP